MPRPCAKHHFLDIACRHSILHISHRRNIPSTMRQARHRFPTRARAVLNLRKKKCLEKSSLRQCGRSRRDCANSSVGLSSSCHSKNGRTRRRLGHKCSSAHTVEINVVKARHASPRVRAAGLIGLHGEDEARRDRTSESATAWSSNTAFILQLNVPDSRSTFICLVCQRSLAMCSPRAAPSRRKIKRCASRQAGLSDRT